KIIQQQFEEILHVLRDQPFANYSQSTNTYLDKMRVVLDIGCCSGDLHTRIAGSLNNAISAKPNKIHFIGLDKSPQAIAKVTEDFKKSPELYSKLLPNPTIQNFFLNNELENDYFSDLLIKFGLEPKANLIIASHIAYYA